MKFKRFCTSLFLVAFLASPVFCFAADALKGNEYYAKAQYKQAINSYKSVVESGFKSASLFYNLGNAYFKVGDIPSALLYYEKAHLLSPGDEDINFNISFANSKTVDKIDEAPQFFITQWWTGVILAASADTLAAIAIGLVLTGSALLIVYFFSNNSGIKRISFFSALTLFIAGLFFVFMAHSQVSYFNDNKQAIIFSSVVNVKSSPAGQSATVFVLHDGTKVKVKETNGEWVRIKLANGNEGWLKTTDIKEI